MNNNRIMRVFVLFLIAAISSLPVQVSRCAAAEVVEPLVVDTTHKSAIPAQADDVDGDAGMGDPPESTEEKKFDGAPVAKNTTETDGPPLSTEMKVGLGIGAAVLVGGALALGGGGGGSDVSEPPVPPTAEELVDAWNAAGNSPGSGRTYNGTYHLYDGGSLGYDITLSDGTHLAGGGSWKINEYTLSIRTDHGSRYHGDFTPGNTKTITLDSNVGWILTLTR